MALTFLPFLFPGVPHVRCAFQCRGLTPPPAVSAPDADYAGGNLSLDVNDDAENVRARRRALAATLGVDDWVELRQVHGDALLFEPEPADPEQPSTLEADGAATSRPRRALMIKTADCQPILLADTSGRHVAALHAGWRGNRCNFPGSGVDRFCARYGISPRDVFAVRGPSLGPALAEFVNFDREWSEDFRPWFDEQTRCMDLWSLTRHQLRQAGLPVSHIYGLDICTFANPAFYSYRRNHACGRQASLIWTTAPAQADA